MSVFDHKPSSRCGTWCDSSEHYTGRPCPTHTYCIWCYEVWECDTAMTLEEVARHLLAQPVLADHWHSARLVAPWLPVFNVKTDEV